MKLAISRDRTRPRWIPSRRNLSTYYTRDIFEISSLCASLFIVELSELSIGKIRLSPMIPLQAKIIRISKDISPRVNINLRKRKARKPPYPGLSKLSSIYEPEVITRRSIHTIIASFPTCTLTFYFEALYADAGPTMRSDVSNSSTSRLRNAPPIGNLETFVFRVVPQFL